MHTNVGGRKVSPNVYGILGKKKEWEFELPHGIFSPNYELSSVGYQNEVSCNLRFKSWITNFQ